MRRLIRMLLISLPAACLLLAAAWFASQPAVPDAFYDAPASVAPTAGQLLRSEPFRRKVPAGAVAWRILYTTTRAEGVPALASAIVMMSDQAPPGPRPVIVWTHGTTGVMPGCAPSLLADPFANVPALQPLLDQGWVYVATDYAGQGTTGPHPYLIGEGQARSALDSVRAVRQFGPARAGEATVVWGHSQGGNAALWTGILAPTYAPEITLAGVAAFAPASDLRGLIDKVQHTMVGRIMSSFVLRAYGEAYPDVRFENYASGLRGLLAQDMSGRCLAGPQALFSVAEAAIAGGSIFSAAPTGGALGARLSQNTPSSRITPPLLIAQGLADDLVLPEVQAGFVHGRCADGQALEFRTYAGRDHLSLVAADSPLTADLVAWTRERIEARPAAPGCRELAR
jgi:alpha-beta hydrolase superfamily lysophospholipase